MTTRRKYARIIFLAMWFLSMMLTDRLIEQQKREQREALENAYHEMVAELREDADHIRSKASEDKDLHFGEDEALKTIEGPGDITYCVPATWVAPDTHSNEIVTSTGMDGYNDKLMVFRVKDLCLSCVSPKDVLDTVLQQLNSMAVIEVSCEEAFQGGTLGDAVWRRYPLAKVTDYAVDAFMEHSNESVGFLEIVMSGRDAYVFVCYCNTEKYTRTWQQTVFCILNSIGGLSDEPMFLEGEESEALLEDGEASDSDHKTIYSLLKSLGVFMSHAVSGSGNSVIDFPTNAFGLDDVYPCLLEVSYEGTGDIVLRSYCEATEEYHQLLEHSGPYHGTISNLLSNPWETALSTQLDIAAEGDWSMTFKPLVSMEKVRKGKTYEGDSLARIDEDFIETIHFVYEGDGAFVVQAVGMNGSDWIVETTGPYDETVSWNDPQTFFIVIADGPWSMSW